MVLQPIDKFFDDDYDVGYTYKSEEDEGIKWLLNTGIILVNNRHKALDYFLRWKEQTIRILADKKLNDAAVKGWGAADQGALGIDLGIKKSDDCDKIIKVGETLFKGFTCKELNETRCVTITGNLHVIHYKGSWHNVLLNSAYRGSRSKEKCEVMFDLWQDYLKKFDDGAYFE